MFIKEIIIDGFKSYAQRTVVSGFDPQFNAITGLNGSGKSNILDSICFVLGITNLTHVRAHNLQVRNGYVVFRLSIRSTLELSSPLSPSRSPSRFFKAPLQIIHVPLAV